MKAYDSDGCYVCRKVCMASPVIHISCVDALRQQVAELHEAATESLRQSGVDPADWDATPAGVKAAAKSLQTITEDEWGDPPDEDTVAAYVFGLKREILVKQVAADSKPSWEAYDRLQSHIDRARSRARDAIHEAGELRGQLTQAQAENEALRAVLEQVEWWKDDTQTYVCQWCREERWQDLSGNWRGYHRSDCPRQAALATGAGTLEGDDAG